MIIDCHNHPDWFGMSYEKFRRDMEENGIDKVWLLSAECPTDEYNPIDSPILHEGIDLPGSCPVPFSRCLNYYQQDRSRFVLGFAPDPRRPEAISRLQAAISLYGVKVCGELKVRMMYDNPDAIALFRFCGEKGLPVLFHLESPKDTGRQFPRPNYWYGGDLDTVERMLKLCPETVFIGHALGFWSEISGDGQGVGVSYPTGPVEQEGNLQKLMRAYPNLYADISARSGLTALSRDPGYAVRFLTEFQDRVLYGRDAFYKDHQEFLNGLDLPTEILEKLYSKNAVRLVG